ncbi:hypothetical protein A7C99_5876 [Trichophyton rubrum]|uniref:Uncharacterized protein n=2 Tax=Trichophyton TaxID=5550 RepID=A0A178ETR8_TRIRU|nr:hypothetical protein A7C99_5876 [Trichophyton rubrum]
MATNSSGMEESHDTPGFKNPELPQTQSVLFTKLPPELRDRVYFFVLGEFPRIKMDEKPWHWGGSDEGKLHAVDQSIALLKVCQRMSTIFKVIRPKGILTLFPPAAHSIDCYLDETIWSKIVTVLNEQMPSLRHLHISIIRRKNSKPVEHFRALLEENLYPTLTRMKKLQCFRVLVNFENAAPANAPFEVISGEYLAAYETKDDLELVSNETEEEVSTDNVEDENTGNVKEESTEDVEDDGGSGKVGLGRRTEPHGTDLLRLSVLRAVVSAPSVEPKSRNIPRPTECRVHHDDAAILAATLVRTLTSIVLPAPRPSLMSSRGAYSGHHTLSQRGHIKGLKGHGARFDKQTVEELHHGIAGVAGRLSYLQLLLQLRGSHRYSIPHRVVFLIPRSQHLMLAFGVKEFVQLIESDPASAPTQSLNVAFKRLSVFAYARELADPGFTIASPLFNIIMTLILGSMFYNLSANTSSFYYRG